MAALDPAPAGAGPRIEAFAGTGFRVDGVVHPRGVLLTTGWARDWDAPALDALSLDDFAPLIAAAPEFILLGTGATLRRPAPALVAAIEAAGSGLEIMDSRAAARAWAVLRTEDRAIAAALLPLG
jgi:uncharacterized protein